MMLMVIHFLQCAVDPPILPNLIGLFPEMFDGSIDVHELQYNVPLKLPGLFFCMFTYYLFRNKKKYTYYWGIIIWFFKLLFTIFLSNYWDFHSICNDF